MQFWKTDLLIMKQTSPKLSSTYAPVGPAPLEFEKVTSHAAFLRHTLQFKQLIRCIKESNFHSRNKALHSFHQCCTRAHAEYKHQALL